MISMFLFLYCWSVCSQLVYTSDQFNHQGVINHKTDNINQKFDSFEQQSYRQQIRSQNIELINRHNQKVTSEDDFTLKYIEQFIYMTSNQFAQYMSGTIPSTPKTIQLSKILSRQLIQKKTEKISRSTKPIPKSILKRQYKTEKTKSQNYELQAFIIGREFLRRKGKSQKQQKQIVLRTRFKNKYKRLQKQSSQKLVSEIWPHYTGSKTFRKLFNQVTGIQDFSWRCQSGEIRNQGKCQACYAFATTDSVTGILKLYSTESEIKVLSVQEIIDCGVQQSMNLFGCNGGAIQFSLLYAKKRGLLEQSNYPFLDYEGPSDREYNCTQVLQRSNRYMISRFGTLPKNDCSAILVALQKQPIILSVSISDPFRFYNNGPFDCKSKPDQPMHAVLLVGFQKQVGWELKNSWGTTWGTDGYFWLKEGECKVCDQGFYPVPTQQNGLQNYRKGVINTACP